MSARPITKKQESKETAMQSSRWKKTIVLVIAFFLALISAAYIYAVPGGWVFETSVSRAFPAVRLLVSNDIAHIGLKLDGRETNTQFALATTQAAVREYWLYEENGGSQDIVQCGPSSAGKKKDETSKAECFRSGAAIDIELPAPPPEPTDDKQRTASKEKRKRYREVWLIPYQSSSFNAIYTASAIRWSQLELRPYRGNGPTVKAEDCVAPTDPKDVDECALTQEVLGHPQVLLTRDPQLFIAASAKAATTRFIPAIVFFLMSVCVIILTFDMGLLALWIRGKAIAEPSKTGLVIDAENVWSGVRRILYTLEILGPAIGFAMTVLGLVVAFDKQAFGTQDRALFGSAISAALTVTFCGLMLRLLTFIGDRLIEHLSRWHADAAGMIYPQDTNLRLSSTSKKASLDDDEDGPKSEPSLSEAGN